MQTGASALRDTDRFRSFLVMDPNNPMSVKSALRYWGCTIQAGSHASAAFAISSSSSSNLTAESNKIPKDDFMPLPFASASVPFAGNGLEWDKILLDQANSSVRELLSETVCHGSNMTPPVMFDTAKKSVTLFMPGFEKSEIKLYQVTKISSPSDSLQLLCRAISFLLPHSKWHNVMAWKDLLLI